MIRPALVKVRLLTGLAVAYTVTHVLVESDTDGKYRFDWEASWQVRRGQPRA
ncbi:hypothetical protein [Arthrobacter sp. UYCu712]|uniref:hypothetical protein n=1 Tax=Arthrobacter sp. UYCu712 TaxID=3156340 RepID=UPI00339334F2